MWNHKGTPLPLGSYALCQGLIGFSSHIDDPLVCAKPATRKILDTDHEIGGDQERRSSQSTSSFNLPWIRVPKCTRWSPQRIHSETAAKYVDECLDTVELQHAKAVMTPLTEQKSLNQHDETTACDQETLIIQSSCRKAAVHCWSEARFDVRGKMRVILNLRHRHLQI